MLPLRIEGIAMQHSTPTLATVVLLVQGGISMCGSWLALVVFPSPYMQPIGTHALRLEESYVWPVTFLLTVIGVTLATDAGLACTAACLRPCVPMVALVLWSISVLVIGISLGMLFPLSLQFRSESHHPTAQPLLCTPELPCLYALVVFVCCLKVYTHRHFA